ncbi:Uncharacterized protein TPAR_05504 [Tolypocladium paradoxum]|uniref:Uncharacterized protein n=1 Tax=Tolypocladium paradoxum TaxID=94208 RepID=A0A2S4KVX6_9HYPO|nr:Uncharacterized protein TPAR_05504 [Tolypocladium paradoxum]
MSSHSATPRTSRHHAPSSTTSSARHRTDPRRDPFPFSFTRPFRANPSSTSLVPSTAEGRPIPVDDSTAEHRTSALREINNHYPSRHRYAKSTGAQSSTYSEPVIVRSYHPPAPGRPVSSTRPGVVIHGGAGSGSDAGGPGAGLSRGLPFAGKVASAGSGMLSTMARARAKRMPGVQVHQETKLPPVEAFSFKSFMANMEAHSGGSDINADLDRIAEICARSRYSLSNQYEVHYTPHGSGTSFLAPAQQSHELQGPTLQVVCSDDENMRRQRKRRQPARRNSRAMGTLETIMSSSRSSDEDKTKKKSASEIAEEIRGRAATKDSGNSSPTTSSRSTFEDANPQDGETPAKNHVRRPSTSLALIDGPRQNLTSGDTSTPRAPATGLVSEPALPQASTSQLELRTAPEQPPEAPDIGNNKTTPAPPADGLDQPLAKGSISSIQNVGAGAGLFATLSSWIPWSSTGKQEGRAEGSLRHLLQSIDCKGKGVSKQGHAKTV